MIIYILNEAFQRVGIIDSATSAIFTKRYNDVGDFELYMAADPELISLLTENNYIYRDDDDTIYIIDTINITSDIETGAHITVSGPNIADILGRRIIWNQTNFSGTVGNAIRKYVDENAINTTAERVLPGLRLGSNTGSDQITIQKTGQNLLEAIKELCKSYNYGFRINFDGENLVFNLYEGQEVNVQFSPEFDNLLSSNYNYSSTNYRNVALVAGEGEGTSRVRQDLGTASGMDRYELYVDARDLSTNEGQITETEYLEMLKTRGYEKLSEHPIKEEFDGEVISDNTYILGTDYNLGDIVTIRNEFGMTATSRIIETIECEDETGHTFIPTFDTWEVQ